MRTFYLTTEQANLICAALEHLRDRTEDDMECLGLDADEIAQGKADVAELLELLS